MKGTPTTLELVISARAVGKAVTLPADVDARVVLVLTHKLVARARVCKQDKKLVVFNLSLDIVILKVLLKAFECYLSLIRTVKI